MINSQNIYHNLVQREYGRFSALGTSHLMTNMRKGNYSKTIFNGHLKRIFALDVQGHLAITAGEDKKVTLWNLETRQCQWTRYYDLASIVVLKMGIFKIAGEHVILTPLDLKVIKILKIETGEEVATIEDTTLNFAKICIVGQSIFTGLANIQADGTPNGDYGIEEWTMKGERKRTFYQSKPPAMWPHFIGSSDFVVDIVERIAERNIFIHQLHTGKSIAVTLPASHYIGSNKEVHMNGKLLFYGTCVPGKEPSPTTSNVCILNLETRTRIDYRITIPLLVIDRILQTERTEPILLDIEKILYNKEWIYFASHNLVAAFNLAKKTSHLLGGHSSSIDYLILEAPLLISGSGGGENISAEVKFWDTRSLTQIGEMQHPPRLSKLYFASNKLLATIQGSFIQWDYLVAHQGENLTKESHKGITATQEECVIQ